MNAKILVADESPTIHKIVAMAFEDEGITVEGISRGEHVMEYMVEYQPDIVLADIHLPGIDGYELCRQIKNFPSFAKVQVILLTSDFEDIDELQLEVSKADDFISKPFKTEEILKKVKSQLNLSESDKNAKKKKEESSPEPENNEVIQNEFEDIVNKDEKSTSDPIEQFLDEDGNPQPSIDEMDLEPQATAEQKTQKSDEPKPREDSQTEEELPEIMADLSAEAIHAETRPVKIEADDLNSVFQSVLTNPESGLEDSPKLQPGTKPNLIEETLTFMTRKQTGGEFDIDSTTGAGTRDSTQALGNKIIKEHVDQVIERLPEDLKQGKSPSVLEKTVRDVLGEVAPKIIRKVIQEEIETIKKIKEA